MWIITVQLMAFDDFNLGYETIHYFWCEMGHHLM